MLYTASTTTTHGQPVYLTGDATNPVTRCKRCAVLYRSRRVAATRQPRQAPDARSHFPRCRVLTATTVLVAIQRPATY